MMSLSCTAITLWRLMTDGHANFQFSRPEPREGTRRHRTVSSGSCACGIPSIATAFYSPKIDMRLYWSAGRGRDFTTSALIWFGLETARTRPTRPGPAPLSYPPFGCYDDKPRGCCLVGLACAKNLPKNDFFFHRASERKLSHSTLALLPALVPAPAEVKDEHQAGECGAPLRKP